jgi:hypothetical protein
MTRRMSREKRWIVLTEDGRHTTVGRHSDPTEDEVRDARIGLRAMSLGGWLALTEGVYYSRGGMSIILVRELEPAKITFDDAAQLFLGKREATLAAYPTGHSPKPS